MSIVYLSIGTNLGDKLENLRGAIKRLKNVENINLLKVSSIYETQPYGNKNQDNFYNIAVKLSTNLEPAELCSQLKKIEKEMGRVASEKWGPRIIDLDIIFYDDLIYDDDKLHIPHLESAKRDFVIVPIIEIESDFYHPREKIFLKDINFDENEKTIIKIANEKLNL